MTNVLADRAISYHDSLQSITENFNNLIGGKWNGIITAPGFIPIKQYPPVMRVNNEAMNEVGIWVEGNDSVGCNKLCLPTFYETSDRTHYFDLFGSDFESDKCEITADKKWIKIKKKDFGESGEQRIFVSIDWDELHKNGTIHNGEIKVRLRKKDYSINIRALKNSGLYKNLFIEENGVVSISPIKYQRKEENEDIVFQEIKGLGYCGAALQLWNAKFDKGCESFVEYDFIINNTDSVDVYVYMLPVFPKDKSPGASYGIQIDDSKKIVIDNHLKNIQENGGKCSAKQCCQ